MARRAITGSRTTGDRNWRSYYWREDFTFLLKDDSGTSWRIISRDPTPWNGHRMGTTYTDLKVDWNAKPCVKVLAVKAIDRLPPDFYDFKLNEPNLATALAVYVETKPDHWEPFFVNNWFHKASPVKECAPRVSLGSFLRPSPCLT